LWFLSVHWLVVFVCESWQEWAAAAVPDGLIAEVPVSAAAAIGARQPSMPPPKNLLAEASTGASSSGGDLHKEARIVVVVAVSGVTLRCGSCH
jgi:hypothetical protein